jgi:acetyltransferase-like isoleucine patch superfamily enzyme
MLLTKFYRKFFEISAKIISFLRILHLQMKYPGLRINFGSNISRGCEIVCADSSQMSLKNVYLSPNVVLRAVGGGKLKIANSYIGYSSVIVASEQIEIKDNCQIAEMVVIRDQNHRYGTNQPLDISGLDSSPINIERNVWIGAKATILRGVEIGDNAVIGANAVVTKKVPEGAVVGGIPAKNLLDKH